MRIARKDGRAWLFVDRLFEAASGDQKIVHSDRLYAKWTGSQFGDPFRDAYFIDYFGEGRDLVFIVGLLPEGMRISAHAWQGFGFQFLGESDIYPWIGALRKGEHGVVADLGDHTQEFVLYDQGQKRGLVEWPLAEN